MPGPFALLQRALEQSAALRARCRVYIGSNRLAQQGSPPRIVLYPTTGNYEAPAYKTSLTDVEHSMVARIWGTDLDDAWDLHERLFQALDEYAVAGGLSWKSLGGSIEWDTSSDTVQQGEALTITFSVRLAANRPSEGIGEVEATSLTAAD